MVAVRPICVSSCFVKECALVGSSQVAREGERLSWLTRGGGNNKWRTGGGEKRCTLDFRLLPLLHNHGQQLIYFIPIQRRAKKKRKERTIIKFREGGFCGNLQTRVPPPTYPTPPPPLLALVLCPTWFHCRCLSVFSVFWHHRRWAATSAEDDNPRAVPAWSGSHKNEITRAGSSPLHVLGGDVRLRCKGSGRGYHVVGGAFRLATLFFLRRGVSSCMVQPTHYPP